MTAKEKAKYIDHFLKELKDASFPSSLASIIELKQIPSSENREKFKLLEFELEKYDLVQFVRGRDNTTLGGQCEYWISGKGIEYVMSGRSTYELFNKNTDIKTKMNLDSRINELLVKAKEYSNIRNVEDIMTSKINSYKSIELYTDWFLESRELFGEYFDETEMSYKEFSNFNTNGNGFSLSSKFSKTYPLFKILVRKIKSGKYNISDSQELENEIEIKENMEKKSTIEPMEVFVTYSWDSEAHKTKVLSFTNFLRDNGFYADIDRKRSQEKTSTDFTKMMHQGITDYQKVIIVLSEGYKNKANAFEGGVGSEYQMIIKDIEDSPQKYILVCFDEISSNIFPTALKDREVINVSKPENHKILFAKLLNQELIKFASVADNKPKIEAKEIPKFEQLISQKETDGKQTQNILIEIHEVTTKPEAGSFMKEGLYFLTKHIVTMSLENISQSIVDNALIQVKVPVDLTPEDHKSQNKDGFTIYKRKLNEKIYPTESVFIELGHIEISNKTASKAFNSTIIVSIMDGLNTINKEFKISDLVYVTNPFGGYDKEELSPGSYHDKNKSR